MKGWLDNFGKADNANESKVSMSEDFVGLGYNTKGRNYSPAWGGQFEDGGIIPSAQTGKFVPASLTQQVQQAVKPTVKPTVTVPYLQTKDPKEFYKSWIQSPEYARRQLLTGYSEGEDVYMPNAAEAREIRLGAIEEMTPITYSTREASKADPGIYGSPSYVNINPSDYVGTSKQAIEAHELAHIAGAMGNRGQGTRKGGMSNREQEIFKESMLPIAEPKLSGVQGSKEREASKRALEDFQHSQKPDEVKADLDALRFMMYDKGIYDITKGQKFTETDFEKSKQNLGNDRVFKRLEDRVGKKNFVKLMNTIASADQEEAPIAMGGMSIPGSVGFSYARTAGAAPSKGKYAKKTMASAQNGIIADKIAGLELKMSPEYQRLKYLQSLPQLRQAPGRGEELVREGLATADIATDLMQIGNFIPHPMAQGVGKAGNILGSGVDLAQAVMSARQGDYLDAAINLGSVGLAGGLAGSTFRRNSKYLQPGQPLYTLSPQAFGSLSRTNYIEPFRKVGKMTDKNLLANRALLGLVGAETVYDAIPQKEYGGDIPSAQNGIEKAQLGKYIPSWANPMNWGVADYTDKKDFNSAYAAAKRAGEEEFMFNGERYSTDYKGTPEQEMRSYGITGDQRITGVKKVLNPIRENLVNLRTGFGYDTPLEDILSVAKGQEKVGDKVLAQDFSNEPLANASKEQDALRLYMGLPQKGNTFTPSRYKEGAFELSGYNELLPNVLPSDEFIENYGQPLKRSDYPNYELNKQDVKSLRQFVSPEYSDDEAIPMMKNVAHLNIKPLDDMVMGRHTVRKGKDDRGEYLEYIDYFDFDTYKYPVDIEVPFKDKKVNVEIPLGEMSDAVNKPFDIYGRKYYKDYGDGVKKAMYYTDKELSQLDPKKKNFDTLALQRELSNRGYELKKSTKSDGSLDGVLGEETKKALADFKKKNKSFRTGGSIPSAQNGQEMRFYQNGLDWKPKSMQDGGEESLLGKATKFVSEEISDPVTTVALGLINKIKPLSNTEIYKTVRPVDYPNALKLPVHAYNYLMGNESEPLKTKSGKPHLAEEFWATAMGMPVEKQYLKESQYKPSKSKDPDAKYYTIRDVIDDYQLMSLTKDLKPGEKMEMNGLSPILDTKWYSQNATTDKGVNFDEIDPLQRYTLEKSPDGSYVSIYDKYDFNNPALNRMMKPIEIYDRFYLPKKKDGGIVKDNDGYLNPNNFGKVVEIDSNNITMEGVYEPLLGISDTGDTKLMKPGKNYKFKGKKVTEFPVAKLGINQLDAQPMKKLNQLLNFTNNPDKDNWLDKYN